MVLTVRPAVTFTLKNDPHTYALIYDFNVVCDHEAETGANLMEALVGGVGITAAQTRGILYCFLKPANPDVLLAEAGELLNRDIDTCIGALSQVIKAVRDEQKQAAAEVAEMPQPEKAAGIDPSLIDVPRDHKSVDLPVQVPAQ